MNNNDMALLLHSYFSRQIANYEKLMGYLKRQKDMLKRDDMDAFEKITCDISAIFMGIEDIEELIEPLLKEAQKSGLTGIDNIIQLCENKAELGMMKEKIIDSVRELESENLKIQALILNRQNQIQSEAQRAKKGRDLSKTMGDQRGILNEPRFFDRHT